MPNQQFGPSGAFSGDPVSVMSGTFTTTGNTGSGVAVSAYTTARLTLNVTAASGTTPSMTVTVETSGDGTTWSALGSFAAKTGVASERKTFSGLDNYVRCSYTISGTTPSFTATVSGVLL